MRGQPLTRPQLAVAPKARLTPPLQRCSVCIQSTLWSQEVTAVTGEGVWQHHPDQIQTERIPNSVLQCFIQLPKTSKPTEIQNTHTRHLTETHSLFT
jgi:hypothetical protein